MLIDKPNNGLEFGLWVPLCQDVLQLRQLAKNFMNIYNLVIFLTWVSLVGIHSPNSDRPKTMNC